MYILVPVGWFEAKHQQLVWELEGCGGLTQARSPQCHSSARNGDGEEAKAGGGTTHHRIIKVGKDL